MMHVNMKFFPQYINFESNYFLGILTFWLFHVMGQPKKSTTWMRPSLLLHFKHFLILDQYHEGHPSYHTTDQKWFYRLWCTLTLTEHFAGNIQRDNRWFRMMALKWYFLQLSTLIAGPWDEMEHSFLQAIRISVAHVIKLVTLP